jgi:hypothetical protein
MARIAISGHRGLPGPTIAMVDAELRGEIATRPARDLVGISFVADGPDALFARAVLDHGGRLEVVVPAERYRAGLPVGHHPTYDRLLLAATAVHRLPFRESSSQAHMAASERMLDLADELYAVWDGLPARGFGGTADVVSAARRRGLPVTVIWPAGATRD